MGEASGKKEEVMARGSYGRGEGAVASRGRDEEQEVLS
jgi:hypothetical protein